MRRWMAGLGLAAALLLGAGATGVIAAGASDVVGTFTLADNGQGGWAGGPLLADGTVGGGGALSFANGQVIAKVRGDSWSRAGSQAVNICFDVTQTKGPAGAAGPPVQCFTLPVTGTPIKVSMGGETTVIRVTLT